MKQRATEHPILFSTPMVQAILEGRKIMTRRILKVKGCKPFIPDARTWSKEDILAWTANGSTCPYGIPGDKLWVRETFMEYAPNQFEYKSGFTDEPIKWKPSIHMPKVAARIWLQITDIRVERLQDISEEEAKKEGLKFAKSTIDPCYLDYMVGGYNAMTTAYKSFRSLWRKINGEESWDVNPWVWIIEFKRIDNIQ